jgi:hypothetical protein
MCVCVCVCVQLIFMRGLVQMTLCGPLILHSHCSGTVSERVSGAVVSESRSGLFGGSTKTAALLWARGIFG